MTVTEELRRRGMLESIGDPSVFVSLQANTPSIGNAEYYARIIEEHALLRRLLAVAGEITELGYSVPEDVTDVLDRAERLVFDVAQRRVVDSLSPLRDVLGPDLDHLEQLYERSESVTGLATGYHDLDQLLAGLQPSNLIVVGARPAMGKTSFALGMVAHAGIHLDQPVLLFSLEMSHMELTQRLLSAEAQVDATRMRTGKLQEADWPKIGNAISRMSESPDLHRRQPEPHGDGHPGPGPATEEPRGSVPGGGRLHAADERPGQRREPAGRGVGDQPGAQDPRP